MYSKSQIITCLYVEKIIHKKTRPREERRVLFVSINLITEVFQTLLR